MPDFYENSVNKILRDIVAAVKPEWCVVRGEFTPRGPHHLHLRRLAGDQHEVQARK